MPTDQMTYYHHNASSTTYTTRREQSKTRNVLTADAMRQMWNVTPREEAACEAAAVHVGDEGPSAIGTLCRHLYGRSLEGLSRQQARRTDKLIYLALRLS